MITFFASPLGAVALGLRLLNQPQKWDSQKEVIKRQVMDGERVVERLFSVCEDGSAFVWTFSFSPA